MAGPVLGLLKSIIALYIWLSVPWMVPGVNCADAPVNVYYHIQLSSGDLPKTKRLVCALYHPSNVFLFSLAAQAPEEEHTELTEWYNKIKRTAPNVRLMDAPEPVSYKSYSMVGTFVRGMAMALVDDRPWDYFVPLSPSDYPAIHTESIRAALAHTARFQLSFVDSRTSERFRYRSFRTCLDPSSFSSTGTRFEIRRGHLFGRDNLTVGTREVCSSDSLMNMIPRFRWFKGQQWFVLHRSAAEYILRGDDGLGLRMRTYFSNFYIPDESLVQTTLCNSPSLRPKLVNHPMRFLKWKKGGALHPELLDSDDALYLIKSGHLYARKFLEGSHALDILDASMCPNGGFFGSLPYGTDLEDLRPCPCGPTAAGGEGTRGPGLTPAQEASARRSIAHMEFAARKRLGACGGDTLNVPTWGS